MFQSHVTQAPPLRPSPGLHEISQAEEEVEPVPNVDWPAGQDWGWTAELPPAHQLPTGHWTQKEEMDSRNSPAGQEVAMTPQKVWAGWTVVPLVQLTGAAAPPVQTRPAGQGSQKPWLRKRPAGHVVRPAKQLDAATFDVWPAGQAAHEVRPVRDWTWPRVQLVQEATPLRSAKVPTGQELLQRR